MNINFRKNFFYLILLIAVMVVAVVSYNRFMVDRDYVASYEGFCDPYVDSCFWGCEDDDCNDIFYYTIAQKYAPDLYNQCGIDVSECDEASVCLPDDRECSITYCDPEIDDDLCEQLSRKPFMPEVFISEEETLESTEVQDEELLELESEDFSSQEESKENNP